MFIEIIFSVIVSIEVIILYVVLVLRKDKNLMEDE
jgi:hypothetical protein